MKKAISVLMTIVMIVSSLSLSITAFADDDLITVYFSGTEYNSDTEQVVKQLNIDRLNSGKNSFTIDDSLTTVARLRAKELFILNGSDLPNGKKMNAYIPDYDEENYLCFNYNFESECPTLLDIYRRASTVVKTDSDFRSIGMGIFTVGNITTMSIILSKVESSCICIDYTDKTKLVRISALPEYAEYILRTTYDENYLRHNPRLYFNAKKGLFSYIDITQQFDFKSSDNAVCKSKSNIFYPKKNGEYSIVATNKYDNNLVVTKGDQIKFFTNLKVSGITLKSSKKKQMTVKWKKNIKNADGYEIQYSTYKTFKKGSATKTATISGNKTLSKTIKNLNSGKTYYVRIRGYENQGNSEKYYGAYSKTCKVKIK